MIGALAQLGERLHGMQEVSGSIPLGSTIFSEQVNVWGTFTRKNPKPKAREAVYATLSCKTEKCQAQARQAAYPDIAMTC